MIEAIQAISVTDVLSKAQPSANISQVKGASFDQILMNGIEATNSKLVEADKAINAFALDGSVPAHRVTFALEEARLSLELMLQVRNRMVEGFQQVMNMQV